MWGWSSSVVLRSSLELVVGAEQSGFLVVVGGVADGRDALGRRAGRECGLVALARACSSTHHYLRQALVTFEWYVEFFGRSAQTDIVVSVSASVILGFPPPFNIAISLNKALISS